MPIKDLTGKKFNRLTVISYAGKKNGRTVWNCICDCGNKAVIYSKVLINGSTKSCGCYNREKTIEFNKTKRTHNLSKTRLYHIWSDMKHRCYYKSNDNYKDYGERGITICSEWLLDNTNFFKWALANGYSDNLTIDRIDSSKGYSPENCRWVDLYVQNNNRRTVKQIEYHSETHSLSEWSRILKINRKTLEDRIYKSGWSIEKAFETPVKRRA